MGELVRPFSQVAAARGGGRRITCGMDAMELRNDFGNPTVLLNLRQNRVRMSQLQPPESNVDAYLRWAIEHRYLIRLVYHNKERIVEPHDYGILNGTVKLLAY